MRVVCDEREEKKAEATTTTAATQPTILANLADNAL